MGPRLKRLIVRAALGAALLGLFFEASSFLHATGSRMTSREEAVMTEVNRIRADHGLPALHEDVRLIRAARDHSEEMVATGTFEHGSIGARVERQGVKSGRVGETLGWSAPLSGSVDRIVAMWLRSPEHRVIVLSRTFHAVGVGISVGPFMSRPSALVVTADYLGPAT